AHSSRVFTHTVISPSSLHDALPISVEEIAAGTDIALRQPGWLAGEPVITVNGTRQNLTAENGFFVLTGLQAGDAIEYTMPMEVEDRKSTRLNSSHVSISYAVFCLKK